MSEKFPICEQSVQFFVNAFDRKKPSSASTFIQVYSLCTFHLFYGPL